MQLLSISFIAGLVATLATADTLTYNTNPSIISCGGAVGCVQTGPTSVTVNGTITLSYVPASGVLIGLPATSLSFGSLTVTGTGTGVSLSGIILNIVINATITGTSTTSYVAPLPNGLVTGATPTATITFSPSSTLTGATTFTVMPTVYLLPAGVIGGTTALLSAPAVAGTVTILGTVTSTPEPSSSLMMSLGFGGMLGLWRRRATRKGTSVIR